MTASTTIVKVGGSLFDWPGLAARLEQLISSAAGERMALVAGGGGVVDAIRHLDRTHLLGEASAHELALLALDVTAHTLAALVPQRLQVALPGTLGGIWESGQTPILLPRHFLDPNDAVLPKTWETTSDSIAARLAVQLRAGSLLLLKSTEGPEGMSRADAVHRRLVDPIFEKASRSIERVAYLNFRNPDAPTRVLVSVPNSVAGEQNLDA